MADFSHGFRKVVLGRRYLSPGTLDTAPSIGMQFRIYATHVIAAAILAVALPA
jgi:hypothetical protein